MSKKLKKIIATAAVLTAGIGAAVYAIRKITGDDYSLDFDDLDDEDLSDNTPILRTNRSYVSLTPDEAEAPAEEDDKAASETASAANETEADDKSDADKAWEAAAKAAKVASESTADDVEVEEFFNEEES